MWRGIVFMIPWNHDTTRENLKNESVTPVMDVKSLREKRRLVCHAIQSLKVDYMVIESSLYTSSAVLLSDTAKGFRSTGQ